MEKNKRDQKLQKNVNELIKRECDSEIDSLKARPDYFNELGPFLETAANSLQPEKIREKTSGPFIGFLCIQTPFELFHMFNLQPFKLCGGSHAAQRLSVSHLPALTCPVIKSTLGILKNFDGDKSLFDKIIVPTTCDWVVKSVELADYEREKIHFLELPHIKQSEKGESRWEQELLEVKKLLEKITGKKLKRKTLLNSINRYLQAGKYFNEIIELRREKRISALFFTIIVNAFPFENIETWIEKIKPVIERLKTVEGQSKYSEVLLTGAPIVFPNLKLLSLIEKAGMTVTADDLCSSERIFPGGACYDDTSEYGLMKALADRYHKACICPTYADNDHRIKGILNILKKYGMSGVIYHVLKGCHPYDIESLTMEKKLKDRGYKFIKIETDYVEEDSQNLLTRLEAFKNTL
jgi:benzoyl-CoA reductase/2-hydroxyglutaryl-CoA dehydratase subunit BcrC/BadD/HgdB